MIHDVQNYADKRNLEIQKVGVKNLAFQAGIVINNETYILQGTANCYAFLASDKKGTHMSRMVRGVNRLIDNNLTLEKIDSILTDLYDSLETESIYVELITKCLRKKSSPITAIEAYEDFKIDITIRVDKDGINKDCNIEFIGTSLCPASKINSKYGAHNQRSVVNFSFKINKFEEIFRYIDAAERQLSSPVYPVLKLEDEAYVTQKAFENPGFVEDFVRDIVVIFKESGLDFDYVSCENLESIHTHNAYAIIYNKN